MMPRCHWLALPALCALLAACETQPPVPATIPPALHTYRIAQQDWDGRKVFETCIECPRPTLKTLPGVVVAKAPALVLPPPPPTVPPPIVSSAPRRLVAVVQFDLNSSRLRPAVKAQMDALAPLLRLAIQVQVTGYTDDLGARKLNTRLAQARAQAVVASLQERLERARPPVPMVAGAGRPLCCYVSSNQSEVQRAPNRRAEMVLHLTSGPELDRVLSALPPAAGVMDSAPEGVLRHAGSIPAPLGGALSGLQP
ncbi:exported hypothetical protein [Rubrivivax sp. A210]|uniref:OmpA family protein n=1 Tax=Rubrivivax sp. A210 TaxID=2772301 RepID=UPI00191ACD23|nr:OmpA family protein [Rubrivivax sp. A210]CAD5366885.1 exported hypothetical protein [Rubrivivax sp. A210]